MSRIAKPGIVIPPKVTVASASGTVTVKGPKGTLSRAFLSDVAIAVHGDLVTFTRAKDNLFTKALVGTYASHVRNMIEGVTAGYSKRLLIEGTGYRAAVSGDTITLSIGFSHPVPLRIPVGLKVTVDKTGILIEGIDKELVSGFAAEVRSRKKPEPYKGKGIRYEGEVILRKEGKKTTA